MIHGTGLEKLTAKECGQTECPGSSQTDGALMELESLWSRSLCPLLVAAQLGFGSLVWSNLFMLQMGDNFSSVAQ